MMICGRECFTSCDGKMFVIMCYTHSSSLQLSYGGLYWLTPYQADLGRPTATYPRSLFSPPGFDPYLEGAIRATSEPKHVPNVHIVEP